MPDPRACKGGGGQSHREARITARPTKNVVALPTHTTLEKIVFVLTVVLLPL